MRDLTRRQREMLKAIADTGSEQGAADKLEISLQTVKNTTLKVRKNMDAKSTLQAVYWLMQRDGTLLPDD